MHNFCYNVFQLTFNLQLLPASVLIFDIHDSPNHSGALKKKKDISRTQLLTTLITGCRIFSTNTDTYADKNGMKYHKYCYHGPVTTPSYTI